MRMIFAEGAGGWEGHGSVVDLGPTPATLLWALRRLALMQPIGVARCHAVHIALQQDFGDTGMGVEHVLRCILVGLAQVSTRRLVIGEPGCAIVMPDEVRLLALVDGTAGAAILTQMTGAREAARLMPLFRAIISMTKM